MRPVKRGGMVLRSSKQHIVISAKNRRSDATPRAAAAMAAVLVTASLPGAAGAQAIPIGNGTLPGMRFYDAVQLTPTSAKQNYFDGRGDQATYAWSVQKPWEITATAAALENDPQKIFAFVKNNIRVEARFGVQKGAVGALIDRSGTPFDQAQLLVELLRAAGHNASYQVGTITVSGTEFVDWYGVSDSTIARQFLANGGIPADVQGTGAITQVTMTHAWVRLEASGELLDPSYKKSQRWSAINVAAGANMPAGDFVSMATGALGSGSENGVPYVTGVNLTGIATSLDSGARALLTVLESSYSDKRPEEVFGGERIVALADPWAAKTTGTLSASWGVYGTGLPDKYRAKVTVAAANCKATLFADEIYGRRLTFRSRGYVEEGPPRNVRTYPAYDAFALSSRPLPGETYAGTGSSGCVHPNQPDLSIAVDLPYAAPANGSSTYGTWMDRTSLKQVDRGNDVDIVVGWGDAGSELQARLADDFVTGKPWSLTTGGSIPGPGGAEYYGPPLRGGGIAPPVGNAKLYGAWLAQMSRASRLVEGVSNSRVQHHYTVGAVYTHVHRQVAATGGAQAVLTGDEPPIDGSQIDAAVQIDIDSGFSVTSLLGSSTDQKAVRHTIAAVGAMLEGSMFEQQQDAVDTSSTAQRFPWGQENFSGSIRYHLKLPGATGVQEYRAGVVPTSGKACQASLTAELGYAVIQPNDRYLGPGTTLPWTASVYSGLQPYPYRAPQSDPHMHRGCAWIAFNADASEIAHVVSSVDRALKGAGGPSSKEAENRKAPDQADLLKDKFKDRSNIGGVDLRTGSFTYRPDPDVVVGQGEFPYSLQFQRIYQAGGATCPKCVPGWTHNFDIRANMSGGGLEGMGQSSVLPMAAPLVALKATFELYRAAPSAIATHLAGAATLRWLSANLTNNVVTVNQGGSSETFVRLADGEYAAPPASQSRLIVTGARRKYTETQRLGRSPTWLYDTVSISRISGAGDRIDFQYLDYNPTEIPYAKNDYGAVMAFGQGFFAKTWTFPRGVSVEFKYCKEAPVQYGGEPGLQLVQSYYTPCGDRLTKVSNSLGLFIDIDRLNTITSDGRSTFVTSGFTDLVQIPNVFEQVANSQYIVTGAIDVAGKRREYQWQVPPLGDRPSADARLIKILAPVDYAGALKANADSVLAESGIAKTFYPMVNDEPQFGVAMLRHTQPNNGTLVKGANNAFTYTSAPGFTGTDSFTYTIGDTNGASATATVTITVSSTPPVNRPPTAGDVHFTFYRLGAGFPPGTAVADVLSAASDPDGDTLTLVSGPAADFVPYPGNRFEYKNAEFTYGGPREYSYQVSDGKGGTATGRIFVEVPNRPPVVPGVGWEWDYSHGNAWIPVMQGAYDPDGLPLTLVGTDMPNNTSINSANEVRYFPTQVDNTYYFNITVTDGYNYVSAGISLSTVNNGGCRYNIPCP